jgi:hypothetical protein
VGHSIPSILESNEENPQLIPSAIAKIGLNNPIKKGENTEGYLVPFAMTPDRKFAEETKLRLSTSQAREVIIIESDGWYILATNSIVKYDLARGDYSNELAPSLTKLKSQFPP